ncbi:hypothetical protein HDU82_001616 [Entophlyctis luteolus]|nr:hypothetical protein HDU82_001616 [Entophlyctis luteolus]
MSDADATRMRDAANLLFEPALPLARFLAAHPSASEFAGTPSALIDAADAAITASVDGHGVFSADDLLLIINAHPAIGAPPTSLSPASLAEQGYKAAAAAAAAATAASGDADAHVNARLMEINRAYETKFGFRLVEFVNGRTRPELIPVLEARLANSDRDAELRAGLRAMMDIARDRLAKQVAAAS